MVSRKVFLSVISSGILDKIRFNAADFLFNSWKGSSVRLERYSWPENINESLIKFKCLTWSKLFGISRKIQNGTRCAQNSFTRFRATHKVNLRQYIKSDFGLFWVPDVLWRSDSDSEKVKLNALDKAKCMSRSIRPNKAVKIAVEN